MRRWLAGLFSLLLATGIAADPWRPAIAGLGPQARTHLDCLLAAPSREGPAPCGAGAHPERCGDAACTWRHLQGWRALLAGLAGAVPGDWRARLAADARVPTYMTAMPRVTAGDALARAARDCPDATAGRDALEQCVFDLANHAAAWLDIHSWLGGRDPRRRAADAGGQ